ncbi:MAG: hypothetical protein JO295_12280 [Verrucomicrobia bacterium]|nr:hypothetical protein [Verrucomicrobiota bacterium]
MSTLFPSSPLRVRALTPLLFAVAGVLCTTTVVTAQTPGSPTPSPSAASPAPTSPGGDPALLERWRARREQIERNNNQNPNRPNAPAAGSTDTLGSGGGQGALLQHFLERLPPAEREIFQRNLQRWRNLTPEERDALRGQADARRAQMQTDAQRALQDSGLKLNNDGREMFLLRYSQERRKLERELRQKMDSERATRLPAITEELRREFSNASPSPSSSPTASPR